MRLFCLPHAGGSAMLFLPWRKLFPPEIELCPIELPGHGARLGEPCFTRMAPLADALVQVLKPLLTVPFAFFGHSMGAAIAFELARRLVPAHLFVSGRPAPDPAFEPRALHRLTDAALLAALAGLGGTPQAVLAREDLMAALLPGIRADLELIETWSVVPGTRLDCSITALGGNDDRLVGPNQLQAWSGFTTRRFRRHQFPGGHFHLVDAAASVVVEILRDLRYP